ncbi:MAG: UbiA family prenyltransferase [Ignavibacteriaceae bacterium]
MLALTLKNIEGKSFSALIKNKINIVIELSKLRITTFVTLTTVFGFICAAGKMTSSIIAPVIGVLLLSSGSAVVNHFQERDTDALMDRTKNRPIPSGRISAASALLISLILIISGSVVLFFEVGTIAFLLGLLNLFWYNGVYTPLKRVYALAIIPGSLVGAIPPMIGWVAGGGHLLDWQIIILSFFFFIWQIPHFWLLLLVFGTDYEQAGFPTLTKIFNHYQLAKITFIWILATAVTSFLIPFFGIVKSPVIQFTLLLPGLWLAVNSFKLLNETKGRYLFRSAFMNINIFAVVVVIILSFDKLFI